MRVCLQFYYFRSLYRLLHRCHQSGKHHRRRLCEQKDDYARAAFNRDGLWSHRNALDLNVHLKSNHHEDNRLQRRSQPSQGLHQPGIDSDVQLFDHDLHSDLQTADVHHLGCYFWTDRNQSYLLLRYQGSITLVFLWVPHVEHATHPWDDSGLLDALVS